MIAPLLELAPPDQQSLRAAVGTGIEATLGATAGDGAPVSAVVAGLRFLAPA